MHGAGSFWARVFRSSHLIQAVAVGEHLNIRHAAAALGASQSSVSTRIMQLEETLGIRLFERRHRGVLVTEAGRQFLTDVRAGLEQLDHAVKSAGAIGKGKVGRLRIGVPTTISTGFLAERVKRYREEWPDIELDFFDGRVRDAIAEVREGKLDVAFVAGVPNPPDCHCKVLWSEPLLAALPSTDARVECGGLCWRDPVEDQFLVRSGGTGPEIHEGIVRRFEEHGCLARVKRCDVDRCTLMSMVAQGLGVTICGESISALGCPGITFLRLLGEQQVKFGAVWSPHNSSKALRHLLELAQAMSRI
ncbi:LysR family transcriptional regulator [Phyllobacterium phragmitis]|uniref:LysR family transcriptional regulator n=1 Tax=Phyllobacterium phragmitis TaxID=2670329 RepID=A0A2S9IL84_9HYPH|nr:LysR family transcriptional regulator [Phyllobacterium phragmitis]PRD41294.1 LysR family transcriptional regulator [Phyllobacterium phragmitis]